MLRAWDTPGGDLDYLVVGAESRSSLRATIESEGLPLRGAVRLVIEDLDQPSHEEVEAHLPESLPHAITQLDPVGWVGPPLVWCGTCKKWHAKEAHS